LKKSEKPLRGKQSKFNGERRFTEDEIENIRSESGKEICAPIEGYKPLFKALLEQFPIEKRY
jgi:hypothetical protein